MVRKRVTPNPRSFTYDGARNIATGQVPEIRCQVSSGANPPDTRHLTPGDGFEQLIGRVITNSGTANGTVYTVHDVFGNVIAELDATGATAREYIWLPEAEIAPTRGSRTGADAGGHPERHQNVDRPMAVVSGVNTASPALLMVHVDHLNRPVKMTDATGASVWSAVWLPFGSAYAITGAESNTARFPGQWFQLEAGLHYNWHRHYDPSLIGRGHT